MTAHVARLLQQRAAESFVGRQRELDVLLRSLEPGGPVVVHLHGLAGVGKSALLYAFASRAESHGFRVRVFDCRGIEPTERGFLHAVEEAGDFLDNVGEPVVLALDNYEVFGLLDTWMRQVFVPGLSENVRVLLCGRQPPTRAWVIAPEWQGLFRNITLDVLPKGAALALLKKTGLDSREAERVQAFAHGHPLALKLAAAAISRRDVARMPGTVQDVVHELTRLYLSEVRDRETREALDAVSVARRVTIPLLESMDIPGDASELFEKLRELPFVESGPDGLVLHEAVRDAIASRLRASDPKRHRAYRRVVWRQLSNEVAEASVSDLWRYTADMLYLIENPSVREAFFPSGAAQLSVEPARSDDETDLERIVFHHEGPAARSLLRRWWESAPEAFRVVRDGWGDTVGFYCMFDPCRVGRETLAADPLTKLWERHLDAEAQADTTLFLRRWLSAEAGEAPSSVQAACWLDIKRTYLELRPKLRRVYLTVVDLPAYATAAVKLGFVPLAELGVELDGRPYHTAMLDFGPASVNGWLSSLVAKELGLASGESPAAETLMDVDAWELVLDDRRVTLTHLEGNLLRYLEERQGRVVSRTELLQEVWGRRFDVGSNVVEAVVRTLRKKLGDEASRIETVRGVGYRLRSP